MTAQRSLHDLTRDRQGAVMVEYVVVVVLIAIVSIGAWNSYRASVKNKVTTEYTTFGYTGS